MYLSRIRITRNIKGILDFSTGLLGRMDLKSQLHKTADDDPESFDDLTALGISHFWIIKICLVAFYIDLKALVLTRNGSTFDGFMIPVVCVHGTRPPLPMQCVCIGCVVSPSLAWEVASAAQYWPSKKPILQFQL
ncbi:hypothetical protein D9R08_17230 [Rhodophyticola porphyridii]|uniref:Uncharacterized protein n=1 Tax=Rhodophyticola porphyridii TaxID=1852017 RepID=A0A3L9XXD6_9RHOB|nr:hypothetical protein D9R08_17230 [Rhodophyticola porphyridii]